jgi:prepilin-type N-terminal cleavage/methylation domain-containing protein
MNIMADRRGRFGFTLIEILVAMAIASIVATMVLTSFTTVMSAGEYITSRAELSHTTRFIIRSLTEDLASASTLPNNPEGFFKGNSASYGEKEADEIFFTGFGRRFVLPGAGSDQALISWFVIKDPDSDKLVLMRGENPTISDVDINKEKAGAIDVTNQLVSFNLRYLKNSEWADSFNPLAKTNSPEAVRVDFTLADDHGNTSRGQALMPVGGKS